MTSDPEIFNSEKRCNNLFEIKVIEDIVAESNEPVVKSMSAFIIKEIEQVLEIDEKKQNIWKKWLEHNKRSWGQILNVSGHTMVH